MERKDVAIGQIWARKDGRMVKLTEDRVSRGSREFLITPFLSKGRSSWKWDGRIINDLTFVCNNSNH